MKRRPPKTGPTRIGVSARLSHPQPGATGIQTKTLQYLEQSVAHWVMSRNALVFMVPTLDKDGDVHRSDLRVADYAQALDGLVLQGGADVSPGLYGEASLGAHWVTDSVRDAYEIELLQAFVAAGKPVLGICRGAQLINVAFGGTLYQDIPTQLPEASAHVTDAYERHGHEICFEPDTGMARLYPGRTSGRVISIHHQAIKSLGRDLRIEARSAPDGVVEAIRGNGPGYLCGVQWHPEFHRPGDSATLDCVPLLDEFLATAGDQAGRKKRPFS